MAKLKSWNFSDQFTVIMIKRSMNLMIVTDL